MKSQFFRSLIASTLTILACSFLVAGAAAAPNQETIFPVTTVDDSGPGSLREAILAANANPGTDTILIEVDGTVFLSSALPVVTENLVIDSTQREFIINGSSQYRIFEVPAGVELRLNGLQIEDGYGGPSGGAVWNAGILEARDCFFLANFAESGGAIYNLGRAHLSGGSVISQSNADQGAGIYNLGELISEDTTFNGNVAALEGGVIYNAGAVLVTAGNLIDNYAQDGAGIYSVGGGLTLEETAFTANTADQNGGAIYTNGPLEIQGGVYSDNRAMRGGALYEEASATVEIDGAAFNQNSGQDGGAILNNGQLRITGTSLAGNHAERFGGGIQNEGTLVIEISSLSENTASQAGGGFYNTETGTLTLTNINLTSNNTFITGGAVYNSGYLEGTEMTLIANRADLGGAIHNRGELILRVSQFENNRADAEGGGLYNIGRVDLTGVNFTANRGSDGGALLNQGEVEIFGGRFDNNQADLDLGGAIFNLSGRVQITDTIFDGNSVENFGGAIFSYGELIITGSHFSRNNSKWGGAIHNSGSQPVVIRDTFFEENIAGHWGGAILNARSLELEGCHFTNNHGEEFSGALHNDGDLVVRTSEFIGNRAAYGSGGAVANQGNATFTDSIFQNNSATVSGGAISSSGQGTILTLTGVTLTENQAVDGGAISNTSELHLSAVTVSKNLTSNFGGGIYNSGSMEVTGSQFLRNGSIVQTITQQGGAIYNAQNSSVTLSATIFEENFAWYYGGAIASYGPLDTSLAQFINNLSLDMGGAIFQIGGTANITNTTFRGNSTWNYAGTIYTNSEMEIERSLIRNSESWTGGAIMSGGHLRIENSTLSNNLAFYEGGAIQNYGTTTIAFSTLYGNALTETPESGAVQNYGTIEMISSIVAGTEYGVNCAGVVTQTGVNISDDESCTGFLFTDPLLGPLQDNGGPTYTHALLWRSPAVDAGAGDACQPVDQRGFSRPAGLACDLGAYEASQTLIDIDIRPKSAQNAINLRGAGTIPVAVLSQPGFYAPVDVDPQTLLFGNSGWENPPLISSTHDKRLCSVSDINWDGLLDLVCTFSLIGTNFTCDSGLGIVRGMRKDGTWFVGADLIRPLHCP